MALSAAERNKRKRERKKREKDERRAAELKEEAEKAAATTTNEGDTNVEIEYITEQIAVAPKEPTKEQTPKINGDDNGGIPGLPTSTSEAKEKKKKGDDANEEAETRDIESVLRRFQERSAVVTDDDAKAEKEAAAKAAADDNDNNSDSNSDDDSDDDEANKFSKRKLREMIRPSVAELKRRVNRPDLVEAHDVTAFDPDFLIELKAAPGTVPVPRHWGRKRKYLQGKRGFEKKPFKLPDFIVKTGIAEVRDTLHEEEAGQSAKQRNRGRVAPKMGAIDIDYRTLHDAFFKHQSKPSNLTRLGDMYYEGKELETQTDMKPGGPLSDALREALGMASDNAPPPWLNSMQRYGPPPSYPTLKIPGLNAPLPSADCQYGYHPGGWGKPPVDPYGRPLYGGNPFDPPGSSSKDDLNVKLVTSHGKELGKTFWGALPEAGYEDAEESEEEESSNDEMDESSEEEEEGEEKPGGIDSVLPPPNGIASSVAPVNLRKQPGDETPMDAAPKQLYQVLPQAQATADKGAVFTSSTQYIVPTAGEEAPDGAASVLSKALPPENSKKKKLDDDDEDLGKSFKF